MKKTVKNTVYEIVVDILGSEYKYGLDCRPFFGPFNRRGPGHPIRDLERLLDILEYSDPNRKEVANLTYMTQMTQIDVPTRKELEKGLNKINGWCVDSPLVDEPTRKRIIQLIKEIKKDLPTRLQQDRRMNLAVQSLVQKFESGELKTSAARKGTYEGYAKNMIMTWLRRDPRLNGGKKRNWKGTDQRDLGELQKIFVSLLQLREQFESEGNDEKVSSIDEGLIEILIDIGLVELSVDKKTLPKGLLKKLGITSVKAA